MTAAAEAAAALEFIERLPQGFATEWTDARRVLFVGHEPDLSSTVAHLTGAASVRMRKGGLACVEFYGIPEPGGGELAWLLDPDLYTTDDLEGD